MKKGKMSSDFSIKKKYYEVFEYLKESKEFIYSAVLIFFIFGIIGLFIPAPEPIKTKIFEMIKELVNQTEGMNQFELIRFIFWNNLTTSFFGMISGIFLGVPSLIILLFNGYLLGFVSSFSIALEGVFSLWRILPHGIFELPAIFISIGLGLNLGISLASKCILLYFKKISKINYYLIILFSMLIFPVSFLIIFITTLKNKNLKNQFMINLNKSFFTFILVVIPLLFIAAIIEGMLIFIVK